MSPLQALLIDFDGVVVDTEWAARQSWQEMFAQHGLEFPEALWRAMEGSAGGELRACLELAERIGRPLSESELAERRRVKAHLAGQEPLRAGLFELLHGARDRGIRCALVSSSERDWVFEHLGRLDILHKFALVITGEQVKARKPAPDCYLKALDDLRLPASSCLALEDSVPGVLAARAAGIRCVAVPGRSGSRSALEPVADQVLPTLCEFRFPPAGEG